MSKQRTEDGFSHSPDPIAGVEATIRRDGETGDVTVSFGDGSDPLKVNRREFMRISGVAAASAAMAGAACRNPVETIVPYVDRPEEVRVGIPNYYASVCGGCAAQCGALVQTRAGRPVKLEGNPSHPMGQGGLCARGQTTYLDLYDPDRIRQPKSGGNDTTWEELDTAVKGALGSAKGVRLLTGTMSGAARLAVVDAVRRAAPGFRHHMFDALNNDAMLAANQICYGSQHVPHLRFDNADIVVSFGSDFLGTWLSPVEFTKQFASRRDPDGNMNRLVAFEGAVSLTGLNADDRHRVRPSDLHLVALGLAHVVLIEKKHGPLAANGAVTGPLAAFTPAAVAERVGIDATVLQDLGTELVAHAGKTLAVAGGQASAQPNGVALETAVNVLNAALGADGSTIERARPSWQSRGSTADLAALVADMDAGKVDVLIVSGTNPVYSAPNSGFAAALEKVATVISVADRVDETAAKAKFVAAASHPLESWGDAQPQQGMHSIQQPTVQPLWSTRELESCLLAWFADKVPAFAAAATVPEAPAGNRPGANNPPDPGAFYRFMRQHWQSTVFARARSLASFDRFWEDTLRTGVFVDPAGPPAPTFNASGAGQALPKGLGEGRAAGNAGDLSNKELQLVATVQMHDGTSANNGHLQELPDPVTKHVWGSYISVSPKTYKEAGFANVSFGEAWFESTRWTQGQHVKVTVGETSHVFPVIMQPGLHDDVIVVPLGYGRTAAGVVGNEVGANAFQFAAVANGVTQYSALTASAAKTGTREPIAIVQGAQVLDTHRRPILSQTDLQSYKENPESGIHAHPLLPDMWSSHDYSELKWGMSVDLSKCTGCSACVTACMEENNISVVGKQGILEGREMHWMRIDRYYLLPEEAYVEQKDFLKDPNLGPGAPGIGAVGEPVVGFSHHMDNPRTVNQPMMCQHCEHAPCETVCPVSATMHSHDGLNQMAYNRCVGTRYCANNCPYKVRRFNWYNYQKPGPFEGSTGNPLAALFPEMKEHERLNVEEPLPRGYNPDVTVRARGVMEKCTFCVQRIRRAAVDRRKEGRTKVHDGDVVTACQQSCPADAISFGNIADPESAVGKQHADKRALAALAELGVHPSVAYLTQVNNTKKKSGGKAAEHGAAAEH